MLVRCIDYRGFSVRAGAFEIGPDREFVAVVAIGLSGRDRRATQDFVMSVVSSGSECALYPTRVEALDAALGYGCSFIDCKLQDCH